jgi:hypothetical protein
MKKEKLLMKHTTLSKLTKPSSHAWLRVHPNTCASVEGELHLVMDAIVS